VPDTTDETIELPENVATYIAELEGANAELATALEEVLGKADDEDNAPTEDGGADDIEALLEKSDESTRSVIFKMYEEMETLSKRAEDAEALAYAERDARLHKEFVAKAAEFESLPGVTPESFGPVLKSAAESLDDETYGTLLSVLKAANEAVTTGSLFEEIGKVGQTTTGDSELEKAAASLMAEEGLDKFAAIAKAVESNPSLYGDYKKGN
jgi:hypothetical protein